MDILSKCFAVHECQYSGCVHAFVFFRARLLDAFSIDIGDVGSCVGECCLDAVFEIKAVLAGWLSCACVLVFGVSLF